MRLIRLALALAVLLLGGCASASPPSAPAATAAPVSPTSTPEPPPQALTGEAIAASLKASAIPVKDVVVVTAETDTNKLLGRPDQYVVKVSWYDTRVDADNATIELFEDAADLEKRRAYIQVIMDGGPAFLQYMTVNQDRLALLRLPKALTPDQAADYAPWLDSL